MYKRELIDTLSRCDNVFNSLKHIPEFIEIHIILCDSKEELYRKRCELTTHPLAKQKLVIDKEDYITAAGCYIIPPEEMYSQYCSCKQVISFTIAIIMFTN